MYILYGSDICCTKVLLLISCEKDLVHYQFCDKNILVNIRYFMFHVYCKTRPKNHNVVRRLWSLDCGDTWCRKCTLLSSIDIDVSALIHFIVL